ncbi:MAG: Rhomboid protease AarA [Bacteroidota bacterium]|jgi:membrane associated rhomboid family serine protease
MMPLTEVVKNLILINVIIFISVKYLLNMFPLENYFVLFPFQHESFQPIQVVSNIFYHASPRHIISNMIALFFLGPIVEQTLGPKRFLFLYLASGIVGVFAFQLVLGGILLGASGAVNGVAVALALMYPNLKLTIFPLPFEVKAIYLVFAYLLYDIYLGIINGPGDNIAHLAHIWGAVMGAILIFKWGLVNK